MKSAGKSHSILDYLNAGEAGNVLRRLLAAHPDLRAETEKIARSLLGEVTFESIAGDLEDAIRALDWDDIHGRAGRHEWGYVEPNEAAGEILDETVEPFIEDLKRLLKLGLEKEALEVCKGLVLGLYRVEHGKGAVLVEEAPDFPAEAAGGAIETWRETGGRRGPGTFPQDFVDRFIPEWSDMVARIVRRKRKA